MGQYTHATIKGFRSSRPMIDNWTGRC